MCNKLIVLQGLPGSGKTEKVNVMVRAKGPEATTQDVTVCSADHHFMKDGKYEFDPAELPVAHQECYRKFVKAVQDGVGLIIIDNTNLSTYEYSPYLVHAEAFGYEVEIITILTAVNVCIRRNVHNVPADRILDMHKRMLRDSPPPWIKHQVWCDS